MLTATHAAETFALLAPQGAINHPALEATHWWDHVGRNDVNDARNAALAPLAAAFLAGGAQAVITAACGARGDGSQRAWELAMGAVHGPIGAHESQGQHPEVLKVKARCLADLRTYLSVYEGD